MNQSNWINELEKGLQQPLPGPEAQYKMAHAIRRNAYAPGPATKTAGVLALLYPAGDQSEHYLVLIQRNHSHPDDRHGGQISFPGGRMEKDDPDVGYTARREAEEEVGVRKEDIRLLGSLTELYIPVSDFLVHPYVGIMDYQPDFVPQPSEVKSIIQTPFRKFLSAESVRTTDMRIRNNVLLREVPYYDIEGQIVWGATAMMLSELVTVVNDHTNFVS